MSGGATEIENSVQEARNQLLGLQAALRKKPDTGTSSKADAEIDEKSLTDLIKDFVNEDDTAF